MPKVSLVCPAHNEGNNLQPLLDSILKQTMPPNEIIFVEDSSVDNTLEVLNKFKRKCANVRIFQVNNKNISKNRNLAIRKSNAEIIICVDAGCKLDKDYIKEITSPFKNKKVSFVGTVSKILIKNMFDKCFASFVVKEKPSQNYLPKGHAMAFRKKMWNEIGGFSEHLARGAEDTYFGKKAIAKGYRPFITMRAIIYWENRKDIGAIFRQFKSYGHWDAKAFSMLELPRNSKLIIPLVIFFPLLFIHAAYKGITLMVKFRSLTALYYGVGIDLSKILGYFIGLVGGMARNE